jgi:CBS domain-containing protein
MKIGDVMTRNVQVIGPDESLIEAARLMKEQDTGFLPVCDGNKILGSITDRDIVIRAVAAGMNGSSTIVRQAMSHGIAWVRADDDVKQAAEKMANEQIRRLIVVDENKKLVGVVSLGDLATDTRRDGLKADTLEEISKPGHNPELVHH